MPPPEGRWPRRGVHWSWRRCVVEGWNNCDVSTIVFLHAHPDDEASQTAGTMMLAAERGHRVVVVFATGGEHGTV
ncbi:MAG: PIG-L family deacetylase, partial [Brooklawnia sp.]|uniref:PIG-L deacetylase family protein n=1 Tax=Brooklawnia sp. TaxID=2699740 RepID=UPI003C709D7C